jgi:hypothetical protein
LELTDSPSAALGPFSACVGSSLPGGFAAVDAIADCTGVLEPEVVLDMDAALFLLCFSIAPPPSRT